MSSAGFATPLSIEPAPSRLLAAGLVLLHAGAFALTPTLPLSGWPCAALLLAIVASCAGALAGPVCGLRKTSIVRLEWRADGGWCAWRRDGREESLLLLPDSYVHRWLVVLNFRRASSGHPAATARGWSWRRVLRGRRSVVLLPDSAGCDTLRLLRARLGAGGAAAVRSGTR